MRYLCCLVASNSVFFSSDVPLASLFANSPKIGEDNRGVGCFEKKHVHLKWLNGIGDHQPESNRCKLNEPKNTAEMFSFEAFCLLS